MPLWLLILILGVAVIGLVGAGAWFFGYPTRGLDPLRASATEAGERAADLSADFIDWVKLGR